MTPGNTVLPEKWDRKTDVVVIGYGGAGAVTAITVHDTGTDVLILEKAPKGEEGGNSRVAAQGWLTPTPIASAVAYFKALCGVHTVPDDMVQAWAEEMGKNNDWVKSMGGNPVETSFSDSKSAEFPNFPGADCVHNYSINGELGFEGLWKLLKSAVDRRKIEVLYATPARQLVQDPATDKVIGVQAEREGGACYIRARKAVVLTCGGFENSHELIRRYLPDMPAAYPIGTPYNTGDGINMAVAVGADLWHMDNVAGPYYALKVPDFPSVLEIMALRHNRVLPGGMIVVGGDGKRFVDEKYRLTHGKIKIGDKWMRAPTPDTMFMIFDHTLFATGPLHSKGHYAGWMPIIVRYNWSDDNSVELARGWIKKADSTPELAGKTGLDAAALEESVSRWNASCLAGMDTEFGRTSMLVPIQGPPFYAVEIFPAFVNTQGGPRRNARGQVLRPAGDPIPRLYSAGELGSIHSFLYQGGGNIGECLAFGRIAGHNAAAENPRL